MYPVNSANTSLASDSESLSGVPDLCKKKLFEEPKPSEKVKVFLRVRPLSAQERRRQDGKKILHVDSETLVTMVPPSESSRNAVQNFTKFEFTHVYGPDVSQTEFYEKTTLKSVRRALDGSSFLTMSYGITSSGKTYTMQGKSEDPGVIPRAITTLFSLIQDKLCDAPILKPQNFSDMLVLCPEEQSEEIRSKDEILQSACSLEVTKASGSSVLSETTVNPSVGSQSQFSLNSTYSREELPSTSYGSSQIDAESRKYCIWISFAEIYNHSIFDLLASKSTKLTLRKDKKGNSFIKGLQEVCAFSVQDALAIFAYGQKRLRFAETKMNRESSRSHAIFSIKIIQFPENCSLDMAKISVLTFCDLAGSERTKKTKNTGDRLKETCSIHTSLLVLGRCLEALRHNQVHKEKLVVPFRESKLTNLFQPFFLGTTHISLIVNINCCASMFDETMQVMKFSSLARQVVTKTQDHMSQSVVIVGGRITNTWIMSTESLSKVSAMCKASSVDEVDGIQDFSASLNESVMDDDVRDLLMEKINKLVELVKMLEGELLKALNEKIKAQEEVEYVRKNYENTIEAMKQRHKAEMRNAEKYVDEVRSQRNKYFEAFIEIKTGKHQQSDEEDSGDEDDECSDDDFIDASTSTSEIVSKNVIQEGDTWNKTEMEKRIDTLLAENEDSVQHCKSLEEKVCLLVAEKEKIQKELDEVRNLVNSIQVQKQSLVNVLEEERQQLVSKNDELQKVTELLEQLESEKKQLLTQWKETAAKLLILKNVEKDLADKEQEHADLQTQMTEAQQKLQGLKENLNLARTAVDDLHAEIKTLKETLCEENTAKERAERRCLELQERMTAERELSAIALEKAKEEYCQLTKMHVEINQDLEMLKEANLSLQLEKMSLTKSNEDKESQLREQGTKIGCLEAYIEGTHAEQNKLRQEIKKLKDMDDKLSATLVCNIDLKKDLTAKELYIKELEVQLKTSNEERDQFQNLAEELEKKFYELDTRLCKDGERCKNCDGSSSAHSDSDASLKKLIRNVLGDISTQTSPKKSSQEEKDDSATVTKNDNVETFKEPAVSKRSTRRTAYAATRRGPASEPRSRHRTTRTAYIATIEPPSSLSEDDFEPTSTSTARKHARRQKSLMDKENSLLNTPEQDDSKLVKSPVQKIGQLIRDTSPALRSAAQHVKSIFTPNPSQTSTARKRRFYQELKTFSCSPSKDESPPQLDLSERRSLRPRKSKK